MRRFFSLACLLLVGMAMCVQAEQGDPKIKTIDSIAFGPKGLLLIVAATQVSNALGTITPVEKIVELAHRYGARVLIDGAQSIPHIPIDVTSSRSINSLGSPSARA